jgi:hypothetical protein
MNRGFAEVWGHCVRIPYVVATIASAASLAACGDSGSGVISGEYLGQDGAGVDTLVFGPGNEVRATYRDDIAAGIFKVSGKEVFLDLGGDQATLAIAGNGCLVGGSDVGTYCKR